MPRSVASSLSSGSSSSSSQGKRSRAPSSVSLVSSSGRRRGYGGAHQSRSARPATVEEVGEDVYGEASEDVNEGGENEEDDEEEEGTKPFPRRLDTQSTRPKRRRRRRGTSSDSSRHSASSSGRHRGSSRRHDKGKGRVESKKGEWRKKTKSKIGQVLGFWVRLRNAWGRVTESPRRKRTV